MTMKLNVKAIGRSKRLVSLIAAAAIVALLLLNLLLTSVGLTHSVFIDTTAEGLYTLTSAMNDQLAFVDELDTDGRTVKITFCADPDTLISSETTRVPYIMSLQLDDRFDNIEVDTVNVTYNPAAVQKYKPTSLSTISPTDIIVS